MSAVKEGVGHTPGPWSHAHRQNRDGMYRTQVWAEGGTVIATLAWAGSEVEPGHTVSAREANARLIAAAPELLDAAKAAAQAIVEMEDMDHVQRMEWFETGGLDLYDLLRAAIEKATGADQ